MAMGSVSRWAKVRAAAENFLQEKGIESEETFGRSRWHRFAHFWLMVAKSFSRNRCPVRASALAYTTLLALVPLLAVGATIATAMLKKQGREGVNLLLNNLISYVAPALDLQTTSEDGQPSGRAQVVDQINAFISNIDTGALGVTSVLALLFVGISLLRTIEAAFNDIWGVTRGRSVVKSVVYYWTTITLGPVLLVGAIAVYASAKAAWISALVVPGLFVLLSLGFAAFYALMPNTKVNWKAALVGGAVGGCLWQLNNMFSVIYVSRVVSYTTVYGSLAVFPLLLVGLYFSWLIMLFGAQVAYAFQNREAYIEERQAESVNQRGREFIALRIMTFIASRFLRGAKPANLVDISCALGAPSALVSKLVGTFVKTGLLLEVMDTETCYAPARPVRDITVHDVLRALRAGQGIELATREDEWRTTVRTEYERVLEAERATGQIVTVEMLATHDHTLLRAAS